MTHPRPGLRWLVALAGSFLVAVLATGPVAAHEQRTVAGYAFVVGFMNEPVYVGQKSGLEFFVTKDTTPVEGLQTTLKAEVIKGTQKRDLAVSARFGAKGAYESVFFPTIAGPYTFHIFGTVNGQAIDESFTSSATGFNEVRDLSGGQFPVQFPGQADLVADAQAGRTAANQVTIAIALGAAGLLAGIAGIGLALAARRRGS